MQPIKTFRDLRVWQQAHALVLAVYKISKKFPDEEKFGLTSQIRRATISVPANVVEGHKRKSRKDYLHFLNIAESSLEEVKYLCLLAADLNLIRPEDYLDLDHQSSIIGRMLYRLQERLNS